MVKLLMIADDFTGALDSGVKFAERGAVVRIVADAEYDIEKSDANTQVLVIDAETRHMSARQAFESIYNIVKKAKKAGIPHIFKKTDSALRGNIGSELTAMLMASEKNIIHFVAAFPKMGRTTKNGIHYVDGVPVAESIFENDPFEPVICSEIKQIIKTQSDVAVRVVTDGQIMTSSDIPAIVVYDAETDDELQNIAFKLNEAEQLSVIAGCAGLAEALPRLLNLTSLVPQTQHTTPKLVVACGSVNPITRRQLEYAEKHEFCRIQLTPYQKLERGYFQTVQGMAKLNEILSIIQKSPLCIIDTNDDIGKRDTLLYAEEHGYSMEDVRVQISHTLGYLLHQLIKSDVKCTMMITGGDTLLGFMKQINVREITPIGEIAPGTVLSNFEIDGVTYEVISKSGGFGNESLMVDLAGKILDNNIIQARGNNVC